MPSCHNVTHLYALDTQREKAAWGGVEVWRGGVWLHERRCDTERDERVRETGWWKRCRLKCSVFKGSQETKKEKKRLVSQESSNPGLVSDQSGESKYFLVAQHWKSKLQWQITDGSVTQRYNRRWCRTSQQSWQEWIHYRQIESVLKCLFANDDSDYMQTANIHIYLHAVVCNSD